MLYTIFASAIGLWSEREGYYTLPQPPPSLLCFTRVPKGNKLRQKQVLRQKCCRQKKMKIFIKCKDVI